ncbi:hypothetical protein ALC56_06367 [Trachymyrmex septentrionalis]|uniref:Uncharacterized protein n=1 Tax=Trachymyrmex septentrionalis TaxID=34720 RepID=A0A151JWV3_9HYME|nr:hypothetical protein ALC56_06367 [Trachymyrmex septentrionalis]
MIRKEKGRTFHLPLSLQETLDKVCPPEDPINLYHELHILVRSVLKRFSSQITKDSGINDQYTIYSKHAKRVDNESAFKLYQMLKIEDVPMDNLNKSDDNELDCNPIEADDAMRDLVDFGKIDAPIDLSQMMSRLKTRKESSREYSFTK